MNARDAYEVRRMAVRMAVQFTAMMVAMLVLMGIMLYSIVASSTAEATQKALVDTARIDSPRDAPLGVFVAMLHDGRVVSSRVMPSGLPDTSSMARVASGDGEERRSISSGERTYEVLTIARGDTVVQVAVDTHEGREGLDRLLWSMLAVIVVATVVASAASLWMTRRAMRPLVESLALQRRFVADASHELRTPLTLLSTRAQMLRRKLVAAGDAVPQETIANDVSRIVDDSKLLTGILDDMLLSADPREHGDSAIVDVVEIARHAVALAGAQALERNIHLDLQDTSSSVRVHGSPIALQRVFTSLISNALDYARNSVHLTVEARGAEARVCVEDDGPGFDAGMESRVFERFSSSRQGSTEAAGARHYGLGLALAAEIIVHHEGKIWVETDQPGGVIVATLPRATN